MCSNPFGKIKNEFLNSEKRNKKGKKIKYFVTFGVAKIWQT